MTEGKPLNVRQVLPWLQVRDFGFSFSGFYFWVTVCVNSCLCIVDNSHWKNTHIRSEFPGGYYIQFSLAVHLICKVYAVKDEVH